MMIDAVTLALIKKLGGGGGGGDTNVIEHIKVNGVEQEVVDKTVCLTVITNAVNDLLNYYTKTETYTKAEVDALISAIVTLDFKAVDALPTENISRTTIYLVPKSDTEERNIKDEYINLTGTSSGWEKIGDTRIDLSGYVTTESLNSILSNYVTSANLTTVLNDYVTTVGLSTILNSYYNKTDVDGLLNGKVNTDNVLQSNIDLNTIYTSGFYYLDSSNHQNVPPNIPTQDTNLLVIKGYRYATQIYVDRINSRLYFRTGTGIGTSGASWGTWQKQPTESEVSTGFSTINESLNDIRQKTPEVLGIHIDGDISDPASKVTYLLDAKGLRPAKMNYSTGKFDYGSFASKWFVKDCKPCILAQAGYVMKYLDPNDFTKDVDGNTVAIDAGLVGANVMIEHPKTWLKIVPDLNDASSADIFVSPVKIDADYKDFPYIDYLGYHKEKFYMPAYYGCLIDNVMRSLSGQQISNKLTATQEITYCKANGNGWNLIESGKIMLINFLLILMGKSTDIKTVFGQGLHTGGSEAINNNFRTGIHDKKGMFYGTNSGAISDGNYENASKIFGTENYYGFAWCRYLGDMLINGVRRVKMCYGNEDGSTTFDYNTTGDGYVNVGATPSGTNGGFINKMIFTALGMFSKESTGTENQHYCAGQWFNNSIVALALRGGASNYGSRVSPFCVSLNTPASDAWWALAAAPSYT